MDTKKFYPLNDTGLIRNCDPKGCGHFGASRGDHTHRGIDFITSPLQVIKAPFDCKIVRYGYPYSDDPSFRLFEVRGMGEYSKYSAKVFYLNPLHDVGDSFKKGEPFAISDDVRRRHGGDITVHVHFELYIDGKLVDPTEYFNSIKV
ncbi:hypothetical protein GWK08_08845 [Leptobacterium flavescens]|uniref:Peptidoglycan DD-metalloendopeptidase family protein n=1 Tax=Leptobacterium flavescens TaxID=472055 RepID=A0A6P0UJI6_9FLAO|nr:M23 family metallopeptidase [Leptobacterium flavescens]NER13541.1 hypothetical protein [Leptobacterium flavescens]